MTDLKNTLDWCNNHPYTIYNLNDYCLVEKNMKMRCGENGGA